jgi:hypothetical protein
MGTLKNSGGVVQDSNDDDSLCMAAQGECAAMIIGGIVAGIGGGAVLTPFAGVLVGIASEAAAAMVCIGKLDAYCGDEDISALIEELLGDWMVLFFDVEQFVTVEDLLDYLRDYIGGQTGQFAPRVGARRGVIMPLDAAALLPAEVPHAAWADLGVQFTH